MTKPKQAQAIHEVESSLISFRKGDTAKTLRTLLKNIPDEYQITRMVSIGDRVSLLYKRNAE